ncbi:hypothetical protein MPSEU_000567500 [Mayamaea pseudoterrestris]|nr:hypothetical protein MPSEU_000567500 [Mayamaea pseudoterrestris]
MLRSTRAIHRVSRDIKRRLATALAVGLPEHDVTTRIKGACFSSKILVNPNWTHSQLDPSRRCKSTAALTSYDDDHVDIQLQNEIHRLQHVRNVGVFAHVDAGKTTVTERMLALAGVVRRAGSVDDGTTITDFLPAERERGITIQAAAVSFEWKWHNSQRQRKLHHDTIKTINDNVTISLIDTPGHVDFSAEVNRSVAVLDGAILVVDAVAGVQAQTETVWRAMTKRFANNHEMHPIKTSKRQDHAHEPLPCLALVNKMDKEGASFARAIQSLRSKLSGARPLAIQIPIYKSTLNKSNQSHLFKDNFVAVSAEDLNPVGGEFIGVVDLIHMRAITWPEQGSGLLVDDFVPRVTKLLDDRTNKLIDVDCQITREAVYARKNLIESLAETDERMEAYYLNDEEPSNAELLLALRKATLSHQILPVLASAAVRGKGVEPLLDCIADLLPSPLDRTPPPLTILNDSEKMAVQQSTSPSSITLGHPLHPSMLALAFKVVHMKGRGGSGDGRVVFARVYSGEIKDRDVLHATSPPVIGQSPAPPRIERVGGMLELAGGRFGHLQDGVCRSGDVCALVGLKGVVTGDTIVVAPELKKRKDNRDLPVCLAGVSSPKPVLTVRIEAESTETQGRLSSALVLLAVEDPSLVIEETGSSTLLSGLGELHIEVTLDRLRREYGLNVMVSAPSVAYRETITEIVHTGGLVEYDRTFGGTRLQGAVHVLLEPTCTLSVADDSACMILSDPVVIIGEKAREFLGLDPEAREEDLLISSEVVKALIQSCQGALQRGPIGSYALTNVRCVIVDIDAEGGSASFQSMPGTLRAVAANAVSTALSKSQQLCKVLEPTMNIEISLPNEQVGSVLSDLTSRRGRVENVLLGDQTDGVSAKALVRGEVPLVEILGYANILRSLTAGEATFSAEYKCHSAC